MENSAEKPMKTQKQILKEIIKEARSLSKKNLEKLSSYIDKVIDERVRAEPKYELNFNNVDLEDGKYGFPVIGISINPFERKQPYTIVTINEEGKNKIINGSEIDWKPDLTVSVMVTKTGTVQLYSEEKSEDRIHSQSFKNVTYQDATLCYIFKTPRPNATQTSYCLISIEKDEIEIKRVPISQEGLQDLKMQMKIL